MARKVTKELILSTRQDMKKYGIGDGESDAEFMVPFSVKTGDAAKSTRTRRKRYIEGYATTDTKDRDEEIITMEAIGIAKNHLLKAGAKTVFYNHDTDFPIGKVVKTLVDDKGLMVGIKISNAKDVENIWVKIKDGTLNSFSVRMHYKKVQIIRDEITGAFLEAKVLEMELYEVSVVGLPCNPDANITSVVSKSMRKLLDRNTTKEKGTKMGTEKKKTTRDIVAELLPDMLKSTMTEILPTIMKSLKDEEAVKAQKDADEAETKEKEAKAAADEAKKIADEAKGDAGDGESEVTVALKGLTEQIAAFITAQGDSSSRKGHEGSDDGEDGEDGEDVKKKIRNVKDDDTVKYLVHMWANDPDAYDDFTDREKAVAKQVYFGMIPFLKDDE